MGRRSPCWVHKTANVLDKLPTRLQSGAKTKGYARSRFCLRGGERGGPFNTAKISEHIDLAYHGKRAQVPDFHAEIEKDLDACPPN